MILFSSLIYGNNFFLFLNINLTFNLLWILERSGLLILTLRLFYLICHKSMTLLMQQRVGLSSMDNYLLRYWICLSLLHWFLILKIFLLLKLRLIKFERWFRSMNVHSSEVTLYLYKYTVQTCLDHSYRVWAGAPNYPEEIKSIKCKKTHV